MESDWAVEHLQTIRTLMERAALYRRALAPIMIFNGALGTIAAVAGLLSKIDTPRVFIVYWIVVSVLALVGSLLLVRRQSLKEAEPFWSPPTRRVIQALLPAFAAGCIVGVVAAVHVGSAPQNLGYVIGMLWLPLTWVILYGCALHAAGFFMPRGMKVFGWAFIIGGCGLFAVGIPDGISRLNYAHGIMGFFFGVLHLAYGIYLYFTEKGKNAA
ncbi:MAG TPA: hypothetical protein VKA67_09100 [Verrucomicrobiae bacterium]|nr:hypothetical protein [Verrucomicrobiae bacterium]